MGRPSMPSERLLGARLLAALYSVPSDRAFCERLRYDLLFQWFLDLELEEEPFDASSCSKNQQRLPEHQVADEFFAEVVGLLRERNLLSEEHFSVDGTLIESWASLKSFRPKDEGAQGPKGPRTAMAGAVFRARSEAATPINPGAIRKPNCLRKGP